MTKHLIVIVMLASFCGCATWQKSTTKVEPKTPPANTGNTPTQRTPLRPGDMAPKWAALDTNPSSATYKKTLAMEDFRRTASVWVITFDCSC